MNPEGRFAHRQAAPFRLGLLILAVLAGLVLPAAAVAQEAGLPDEPEARPLEVLLQQREALGLTADQLGQLDRIQGRLTADNEPLVSRMMDLRTQWQQERRAARNGRPPDVSRIEQIRSAAQEVRGQLQANNRAAMRRVNRLLTPAQRQRLRGIVENRRQQTPGRRAGGGSAAGRGR
jgi:Spy/CpxP family protein refolding chaperone